jgi:xanthine dehydrogenase accessory factor
MKDIIEILERWTGEGSSVALGSVVERIGSAPRDPGATLAVSSKREVAGGVTGGCVEPAVIREANEVLQGSRGRLVHYGLDDDGFDVGLTCGGKIAVAVYRLDPELVPPIADAVRADRPIAVTLRLDEEHFGEQSIVSGETNGSSGALAAAARSLLEIGENAIVEPDVGEKVFVESYAPRPNMYLFGASDHVAALVPIAKHLGYRVTVCDPRTVFLTRERFPDADELSDEWPDQFLEHAPIDPRTAICTMTHNLKFDVPALKLALASNAGFIGAIGSEKTRSIRDARLREVGIGDADLARLHAPVGIQIGARTPEEVAVTIAAQLIEANVVASAKRNETIARATVLS